MKSHKKILSICAVLIILSIAELFVTACSELQTDTTRTDSATQKLIFNGNGGSGTMDARVLADGKMIELPVNEFTREDYIFAGWSTTSTGLIEYSDQGNFTMGQVNTTLYAIWIQFEYSIINGEVVITGCIDRINILRIPNSIDGKTVIAIADEAFKNYIELTSITLPNTLKSIGDMAFAYCDKLTSINLNSNTPLESIGFGAFIDCDNLINFTLPNTLISIGGWAFYSCNSLEDITLPKSLTTIGEGAFYFCNALNSIDVSNSNLYFSSDYGILFNKEKTQILAYPAKNTNSGYEIPDSVRSIGYGAFAYNNELKSITFPSSLTEIGNSAFENCFGLESIKLPNSIKSIGDLAFYSCSNLSSVTVQRKTPPTLGYKVFHENATDRKIKVPDAFVSTYKTAAGWKDYISDIEPFPWTDSLGFIGDLVFYSCSNLSSVIVTGNTPPTLG